VSSKSPGKVGEQDESELFETVHILPVRIPVSTSIRGEDPLPAEGALPVRERAALGAGTILPVRGGLDGDLQLSLYGLAFWRMTESVPEELCVYHLRENVALLTSRTVAELEDTEKQVEEAGDRMARKVGLHPRESEECKWCDYAAYCPLKTDSPIPVYDQLELTF